MNIPSTRSHRRLGATLIAGLLASTAFSQGSLTPPAGVPGPTQKSLQEIWDKIDALETQTRSLQDQVGTLQNDNAALGLLLDNAGVALPWQTTVATNTLVQYFLNATNHAYFSRSLSLAISPQGTPAISWQDGEFNTYAVRKGASWEVSRWLATEPAGANWRSLQFESGAMGFLPSGQPVIAGFEALQGIATNLVLKTLAGVATNTLSMPSTSDAYYPQLAISARGQPEISFLQGFPPGAATLRLVQMVGGVWTNTLVATNVTNRRQSMAVSSDGQTGIAYLEHGTEDLRLAYRMGTIFTNGLATAIFTNGLVTADFSFKHSLAYDPSGQPAIAYLTWDGFGVSLILTTLDSGSGGFGTGVWNSETIQSAMPGAGWQGDVSLSFGPDGHPAISYSDPALGIRYAVKSSSGSWNITQIAPPAPTADWPFDTVMRFNRSGNPVIAFWDERTVTIKLATRAPYVAP